MRSFVCEKEIKLSKFLLEKYEGELSFSALNKLYRKKDIKVNGKRTSSDMVLAVGDTVTVYYDGAAVAVEHQTIFEDDNVLIVVKPKGVTSENFFRSLKAERGELYFCHRLDRNTDGIMVFAKNEIAFFELLDGFKRRTFIKNYYAGVFGLFEKKRGELSAYLLKDGENSFVRIFDEPVEGSKKIATGYNVVWEDRSREISVVDVHLITGRTHQIRAHLAHVGHFVLGDDKYGDRRINEKLGVKDLALCSYSLELKFVAGQKLRYLDGRKFVCKSELIKGFSAE